jgi:Domain of unknown function (DUF4278)
MQLIYRGTTYDYHALKASSRPTPRTTPYTLFYRGVTYQVIPQSKTSTSPVQTVAHQLIYRGNVYWVDRTVESSETVSAPQVIRAI